MVAFGLTVGSTWAPKIWVEILRLTRGRLLTKNHHRADGKDRERSDTAPKQPSNRPPAGPNRVSAPIALARSHDLNVPVIDG